MLKEITNSLDHLKCFAKHYFWSSVIKLRHKLTACTFSHKLIHYGSNVLYIITQSRKTTMDELFIY